MGDTHVQTTTVIEHVKVMDWGTAHEEPNLVNTKSGSQHSQDMKNFY